MVVSNISRRSVLIGTLFGVPGMSLIRVEPAFGNTSSRRPGEPPPDHEYAAMKAYNIKMLTRSAKRKTPEEHGWCFGLPPGIVTRQWPLDPSTGYPLMHGFTILLPEDYRIHGPDIVGLSFFATAPDHNDGGTVIPPEVRSVLENPEAEPAPDPYLRAFREAERTRHLHLHRMEDALGCSYALILLTREEFDGPFCEPPSPLNGSYNQDILPPGWLSVGAAAAYWEMVYSPALSLPAEEYQLYKMLGGIPEKSLTFNRALSLLPRAQDPNAGKVPSEDWSTDGTGYQSYYYWIDDKIESENYQLHEWAKDHAYDHIGGTMYPLQGIPLGFSPFYIEFGEHVGGYNFGGGNAQLDFLRMKLDWAQ